MLAGGKILALDTARMCGWALGVAGEPETVQYGTKELAPANCSNGYLGRAAQRWLHDFLKVYGKPSAVMLEDPQYYPSRKTVTTKATLKRLWGLSFSFEVVAESWGIPIVHCVTAGEARKVFLQLKKEPKAEVALPLVRQSCELLGWTPDTDDAAAALAVWVWGCEKTRPGSMARSLPAFVGGRMCRVSSRG
jgi:hypothetical protein